MAMSATPSKREFGDDTATTSAPCKRSRAKDARSIGSSLAHLEQVRVRIKDGLEFLWHRPVLEEVERQWEDPGTVRIFLNGCFDIMHPGHFNLLRQAKHAFYAKGYQRVVVVAGLHSDAAIAGAKRTPMLSEGERLAVLRATKWVDEMVTDLPYDSMSVAMADHLRVDWICHGSDMVECKTGVGMYSDAIQRGRFHMLKRTGGISTTQIIHRMLHQQHKAAFTSAKDSVQATVQRLAEFGAPPDPWQARRDLEKATRVVYTSGAFDLVHAGQVLFLQEAATLGDYLLVGVHSDEEVRVHRGELPVLTLAERVLAVLSLRFVDDVVLAAPRAVSQDMVTAYNVAVVATGCRRPLEDTPGTMIAGALSSSREDDQRLEVPRAMGILKEIETGLDLSTKHILSRCIDRLAEFEDSLPPGAGDVKEARPETCER